MAVIAQVLVKHTPYSINGSKIVWPSGTIGKWRIPMRMRYELISKVIFADAANNNDEYVQFRPGPRDANKKRSAVAANNFLYGHSGYFDWESLTTQVDWVAVATLIKNQILDPDSYYKVTTVYTPQMTAFANIPGTMTPEDQNVIGGFGYQGGHVMKYSFPASAPSSPTVIQLKDYRIA